MVWHMLKLWGTSCGLVIVEGYILDNEEDIEEAQAAVVDSLEVSKKNMSNAGLFSL